MLRSPLSPPPPAKKQKKGERKRPILPIFFFSLSLLEGGGKDYKESERKDLGQSLFTLPASPSLVREGEEKPGGFSGWLAREKGS